MLIVTIAFAATSTAFAQTAEQIVQKNVSLMKSAKSYQAQMTMTQNMGPQGSMTILLDAKQAGKRTFMKMTPSGRATGMMAMGASFANIEVYNDGITTFTYMKGLNSYTKSTSSPESSTPFDFSKASLKQPGAKWKLAAPEKVNGKEAFVLILSPQQGKVPTAANSSTKIYIDKMNFHLLQIKTDLKRAGGPQGSITISTLLVVTSEKFNEVVPDSIFKFNPPAGAKLTDMKGMIGGLRPGGKVTPKM